MVYDIQQIADIAHDEEGVRITFQNGSVVRLEAGHHDFEHLLKRAEWSLLSRPVGVVVDSAHRVVDLNIAQETPVRCLDELPGDNNCFTVAFWTFNPICALTRDHPEFDRIYRTLTTAIGTSKPVWVAIHSEETVEDEPDEEGLVPAYPKIMDVRPVKINTHDFHAPPKIKIEEEEHLNIAFDREKLAALGLSTAAVHDAITKLIKKPQASLRSLRRAVIAEVNGKKIRLRDIAEVEVTKRPSHRIYRWPGVEEKK